MGRRIKCLEKISDSDSEGEIGLANLGIGAQDEEMDDGDGEVVVPGEISEGAAVGSGVTSEKDDEESGMEE